MIILLYIFIIVLGFTLRVDFYGCCFACMVHSTSTSRKTILNKCVCVCGFVCLLAGLLTFSLACWGADVLACLRDCLCMYKSEYRPLHFKCEHNSKQLYHIANGSERIDGILPATHGHCFSNTCLAYKLSPGGIESYLQVMNTATSSKNITVLYVLLSLSITFNFCNWNSPLLLNRV